MIRRLLIINFTLLAVLGLLGWQLRQKMLQARQREQAMLLLRMPPTDVEKLKPLIKVAPLDATAYQDAIAKNLFSADRNPVPIPDPPPAPPPPQLPPPFPVAHGVMLWQGMPPTVVLNTKGSNDQRGYHPGEKIGEWTLLSVDNQYIVLEWDGKQFKKRLDELMDRNPIQMAEAPAPQAAPAQAAPAAKNLSESKNGMGADMGGARACIAGDTQAAGTIVDGHKKVVSQTPFGTVCRWEAVQ